MEYDLESRRTSKRNVNFQRINELEKWFRFDYVERLNKLNRYTYLGLPLEETRYALEKEAYEKENELRVLKGEKPLPPTKFRKII